MLHKQHARRSFSTAFFLRYKRVVFVFVILLCAAPRTLSAERGGTLVAAYKDEPSSLNPLIEVSSIGSVLVQIIFDGLITLSPTGNISPRIASKWEVSKDGLTWTFYLRKNVRFHDGTRLTAKDVKFTFDSVMSNSRFISAQQVIPNVKSIQVTGDYTLRFILKEPGSAFLMDLYVTGIIPEHTLKNDPFGNVEFNKHPIGTGPYKIVSWKRRNVILLEANKDYFRGRPNLDKIRIVYIPDIFNMWKQLQLGKIDVIYNDMLPVDFNILKQNRNLKTYRLKDNLIYAIIFNLKKGVFQDKSMRMALNLAIDRRELIHSALQDNGVEANGTFLPGSIDVPQGNQFDPEKSALLLREMGYTDKDGDGVLEKQGKKLRLRILIDSNNVLKKKVLLSIQKQLMEIGVEVVGEEASVAEIYSRVYTGDYDMIFYNYVAWLDMPALVWHSKFSQRGGFNLSHYANRGVDIGFEKLTATTDRKDRAVTMKALHKLLAGDFAAIFLFTKYNLIAINSRIRGFTPDADKFFWEFATDIYIPRAFQ